jgi:hypothetical protein
VVVLPTVSGAIAFSLYAGGGGVGDLLGFEEIDGVVVAIEVVIKDCCGADVLAGVASGLAACFIPDSGGDALGLEAGIPPTIAGDLVAPALGGVFELGVAVLVVCVEVSTSSLGPVGIAVSFGFVTSVVVAVFAELPPLHR